LAAGQGTGKPQAHGQYSLGNFDVVENNLSHEVLLFMCMLCNARSCGELYLPQSDTDVKLKNQYQTIISIASEGKPFVPIHAP
jgi:hypothetical protein